MTETRARIGDDLVARVTFHGLDGEAKKDETPVCTAVDIEGTSLTVGAVTADTNGSYKASITSPVNITRGTVTWTQDGVTQQFPIEWMSNDWPALGQLVSIEPRLKGLTEPELRRSQVALQNVIEDVCGVPMARRFHRYRFTGNNNRYQLLPKLLPAAVLAVSVNGTQLTANDFTLEDTGKIWAPIGTSWAPTDGSVLNCVVDFTYGLEFPPPDLAEAMASHLLHIANAAKRGASNQAVGFIEAQGNDAGVTAMGSIPPWIADEYSRYDFHRRPVL